jgi:hypothetical protein
VETERVDVPCRSDPDAIRRSPAANLDAVVKPIGEAKDGGAQYVQTPEMTNIMK